MDNTPIYGLRPADVFAALESSPQGLTDADVAMRRSLYGNNVLIPTQPRQHWPLLLAHLIHPMALILWGAGALAIAVGQPVWGALIWLLGYIECRFFILARISRRADHRCAQPLASGLCACSPQWPGTSHPGQRAGAWGYPGAGGRRQHPCRCPSGRGIWFEDQ